MAESRIKKEGNPVLLFWTIKTSSSTLLNLSFSCAVSTVQGCGFKAECREGKWCYSDCVGVQEGSGEIATLSSKFFFIPPEIYAYS